MTRHRVVALGPTGKGYTVELVRFLTDEQAKSRVSLPKARSQYKDTLSVTVFRETFNLQGMTTSRVEVT